MQNKIWKVVAIIGVSLVCMSFIYSIKSALIPFLVSFLLVYLMNPLVSYLEHKTIKGRIIPRNICVVFVMATALGSFILLMGYLVPALLSEIKPFRQNIPTYYNQLMNKHLPDLVDWIQKNADQAGIQINAQKTVQQALPSLIPHEFIKASAIVEEAQIILKRVFSAIFDFILVFIVTLFILIDLPKIKTSFWEAIPEKYRNKLRLLFTELDRDLSGSIRGQLSICLINFVLTTLGLLILNVNYAVTLGIIAGFFSFVPVFGSVISTIPIVLISLTVSVVTAVKAVFVIIIIHLLEANLLNPKVMGHHVELHPVIILFAIVVGEHWFGPSGLVIGVPIAASLRSILHFLYIQVFFVEDSIEKTSLVNNAKNLETER